MVTEQYKIVNRTKSWRGNRKVFLTEEALSILQETLVFHRTHGEPDAVYVFGRKEHLLPRTVTDRYAKYCKKLNIYHRSSHKARKTYVSKLLDSGMNPKTVSISSGHDISTMMKHYDFDRSSTDELQARFSAALPAHHLSKNNGIYLSDADERKVSSKNGHFWQKKRTFPKNGKFPKPAKIKEKPEFRSELNQ